MPLHHGWLVAVLVGGFLFEPPQSCLRLMDQLHGFYNADQFSKMYELTDAEFQSRNSAKDWTERCKQIRQQMGRFVRTRHVGHMISPRSLTTISVELWVLGDYENGPKRERIQLVTGLFRNPAVTGFSVEDIVTRPLINPSGPITPD